MNTSRPVSTPTGTVEVTMGNRSDLPIAGDWNGDGLWDVGVRKADSNAPASELDQARDALAAALKTSGSSTQAAPGLQHRDHRHEDVRRQGHHRAHQDVPGVRQRPARGDLRDGGVHGGPQDEGGGRRGGYFRVARYFRIAWAAWTRARLAGPCVSRLTSARRRRSSALRNTTAYSRDCRNSSRQ